MEFSDGGSGIEDSCAPACRPLPAAGGIWGPLHRALRVSHRRRCPNHVWCFSACLWAGLCLPRFAAFHARPGLCAPPRSCGLPDSPDMRLCIDLQVQQAMQFPAIVHPVSLSTPFCCFCLHRCPHPTPSHGSHVSSSGSWHSSLRINVCMLQAAHLVLSHVVPGWTAGRGCQHEAGHCSAPAAGGVGVRHPILEPLSCLLLPLLSQPHLPHLRSKGHVPCQTGVL